jgi:hypothetical protein
VPHSFMTSDSILLFGELRQVSISAKITRTSLDGDFLINVRPLSRWKFDNRIIVDDG